MGRIITGRFSSKFQRDSVQWRRLAVVAFVGGALVSCTTGVVEGDTGGTGGAGSTRPVIASFAATPDSIRAGQPSTLAWNVVGATSLSISPTLGDVTRSTSAVVSPTANTTYTLTASNALGSVTATQTVSVSTEGVYVLPAERTTVWNPGLNSVGGIPNYTNVFATLSPSGGSDTTAIQNALNAAAAVATPNNPQVVYLNAGTYKITGDGVGVPSYVVLRGAGPDATKLGRVFKVESP